MEVQLGVCFLAFSVLVQQWLHLQSSQHLQGLELPRLERGSDFVPERILLLQNRKTI